MKRIERRTLIGAGLLGPHWLSEDWGPRWWPFKRARAHARALGLRSKEDWLAYCRARSDDERWGL